MQFHLFDGGGEIAAAIERSFSGDTKGRDFAIFVLNTLAESTKAELGAVFADAVLFGSYARGDNTEDSDVDICLVLDCEQSDIYTKFRYQSSDIKFDLWDLYGVRIDLLHITKAEMNHPTRLITEALKEEGIFWSRQKQK